MNKFAELINGMSAEERAAMKDDAETFLKNQAEFETCLFCGTNITDLVCDAPIGFAMAGYKDAVEKTPFTKAVIAYRYLDRTSEMFTCDLPVCEACRTQGSAIFFCGGHEDGWYAEALGENKSASDPRGIFVPDLCPLHRSAPSLGTDHPSKRTPVITKEESQTWRAQTRMLIENGKLSKAKAYPGIKEEEKS